MQLQETLNRIRDRLAYLSATVKGASALGQTDVHRLAETVVCPILKITLRLPALRNLNSTERVNFPGIDLGDASKGVGIQVTARADASKLRRTIKTCIRHGVHNTYPHLLFFVLTEKQTAYRLDIAADLDGKITFDPPHDILDYTDVLKVVSTLDQDELAAVDEALEADLGIHAVPPMQRLAASPADPAWLNLLPINFPSRLYLADTIPAARARKGRRYRNPRFWAREYLAKQGLKFSVDWTVYERQIVTFHDLRRRDLPLAQLIDVGTVTDLSTAEYHAIDANYRRAFKTLLRFCLQQLLYKRNVFWQHRVGLFCFGPTSNGVTRRNESWADKRDATREVFKRVPKRDAPEETYHCKHLAFRPSFHVFDSRWYLSIKPDWFFSVDGYRPWHWGTERIERLKRLEKNQTTFNHVKFISHFLRRQPDLFGQVPSYRFLTFEPPASLQGLPELNDRAWRSDESDGTQAKLEDPDGALPLDLGDA